PAGYIDSGTYHPIIPNCMPSSYPSGRFSLITLRTALSAARRSAGSAVRYCATVEAVMLATIPVQRFGRKYSFGARSDDVTNLTWDSVAAAQDGEQNQRADDGNNDRARTTEAVREEGEHRLISSGDAPLFAEQWMASRSNFK